MKTLQIVGTSAAGMLLLAGLGISQAPPAAPKAPAKIETIDTPGLFVIKFYNEDRLTFTPAERKAIVDACVAAKRSLGLAKAATGAKKTELLKEWFGAGQEAKVEKGVDTLNAFFGDSGKTLTFVDLRDKADLKGVFAYVFPLPEWEFKGLASPDEKPGDPVPHVGSGYRIVLGPAFFKYPVVEQEQTMIHELTHKILGADDVVVKGPAPWKKPDKDATAYGTTAAKWLASKPAEAVMNADNWGYYVTSYSHAW